MKQDPRNSKQFFSLINSGTWYKFYKQHLHTKIRIGLFSICLNLHNHPFLISDLKSALCLKNKQPEELLVTCHALVMPVSKTLLLPWCAIVFNSLCIMFIRPVGVRHSNIICDSCKKHGIMGMRWKCKVCFDYDLCTHCYMNNKHDLSHAFERYETAHSQPWVYQASSHLISSSLTLTNNLSLSCMAKLNAIPASSVWMSHCSSFSPNIACCYIRHEFHSWHKSNEYETEFEVPLKSSSHRFSVFALKVLQLQFQLARFTHFSSYYKQVH